MYDEEGRKIDLGQKIGMPLSGMSIKELEEYIQNMRAEIQRVENEIQSKKASTEAADAFFK